MESPAEVNGYYSPQQNRIGKFIFFTEQEVLMQKIKVTTGKQCLSYSIGVSTESMSPGYSQAYKNQLHFGSNVLL